MQEEELLLAMNKELKLEKRGKEAIGKLSGSSPLTDGIAGLRETKAYVKNGNSPSSITRTNLD